MEKSLEEFAKGCCLIIDESDKNNNILLVPNNSIELRLGDIKFETKDNLLSVTINSKLVYK